MVVGCGVVRGPPFIPLTGWITPKYPTSATRQKNSIFKGRYLLPISSNWPEYKYRADQYQWLNDYITSWWDFWLPKLNISVSSSDKSNIIHEVLLHGNMLRLHHTTFLYISVSFQATVSCAKDPLKVFTNVLVANRGCRLLNVSSFLVTVWTQLVVIWDYL